MTLKTVDIPNNLLGHQLKPDYTNAHHKLQTFKYVLKNMAMDDAVKIDAAALETIKSDSWDHVLQSIKTAHPTLDARKAAKEALRDTYRPANMPAWLKHNRQIPCVDAYTTETLMESTEYHRVRLCSIRLYLEDGTTEISAPKIQYAGS